METTQQLSFGQKAVGITFNPSGNETVNNIKTKCAELIDLLEEQRKTVTGEAAAQYTLAMRDIQRGQMWAVKACTWQD